MRPGGLRRFERQAEGFACAVPADLGPQTLHQRCKNDERNAATAVHRASGAGAFAALRGHTAVFGDRDPIGETRQERRRREDPAIDEPRRGRGRDDGTVHDDADQYREDEVSRCHA